MKKTVIACCAALAATALSPAYAQQRPDAPIDAATRHAVIEALGKQLRENYVFPDVGEKTAKALSDKERKKAYDGLDTAQEFAAALHKDLREAGNDGHLGVSYQPNFDPLMAGEKSQPTADDVAFMRNRHAEMAYGIQQVSRLEGNIGYMDLRGFGMPEFTSPAFEGAMRLLNGSAAIIIDLRSNGGGDPASVAQMMSHFFAQRDERHLNSIYERPGNTTREFWTNPSVETRYTAPVYVLTSNMTFSGGEEFAYDMQTQKRGKLYGETTGGGANPGGTMKLAEGFTAFIPTGRAINPVTGTNWEHVGVKPDVATPASDALKTAYADAIRQARENESNPDGKAAYADLLERLERGEVNLPTWQAPGRNR